MIFLEKNGEEINKLTDEELVKMSLANQENFSYIVERYKGRLSSYINRLTKANIEDIEDILQEVFVKVYLNLNDFNSDLKFSSWIYRITHNQVISGHRKLKARPEGYAVSIDDTLVHSLAAEVDIVGQVDIKILQKNIFKILDKLPEKYREILILKFLEEKNYQEISDILKKPLGTVASLLNKAKQEFREELNRQNIKF